MSTPTTFEAPLNDAQWCLSQILGALPSRRDWLDPDLEKMARGIVSAVATPPQEKDELTTAIQKLTSTPGISAESLALIEAAKAVQSGSMTFAEALETIRRTWEGSK